jgi:hypothetical protein
MEVLSVSDVEPGGKSSPMRGKDIARRVQKSPPGPRAALAVKLTNGVVISALTKTQAALMTDLSPSSVSIAANSTADELEALRRGKISLRALRAKRRAKPNENDIEDIIVRAGVERVMSVLDRLTAPVPTAAE